VNARFKPSSDCVSVTAQVKTCSGNEQN